MSTQHRDINSLTQHACLKIRTQHLIPIEKVGAAGSISRSHLCTWEMNRSQEKGQWDFREEQWLNSKEINLIHLDYVWALGEGMVQVKAGEVNSGNTVDEGLLRREWDLRQGQLWACFSNKEENEDLKEEFLSPLQLLILLFVPRWPFLPKVSFFFSLSQTSGGLSSEI